MNLLLLIDDDKSHYVYIKDFGRFMFHKTKNKNKNRFCKICLQCFSSKNVLTKHKEDCLSINDKQLVKLEEEKIGFESCFKQIRVLFKIYVDFECNLMGVESYECSYTKKYQDHVPCSFAYKVVCIDDRFGKQIVVFRSENAAYAAIFKEYQYCENAMNKHFNKGLIISGEEKHLFQQSNNCWICEKLIDHSHVTGIFRGAAHWSCNINLQLTKKVPIIFHNLRGYDSHLIFCELNKSDIKVSVIPNGLEKYMAFFGG